MVTNAHRDWLIGNALLIALLAAVAVCCLCGCGRDDSDRAEMLEGIIKRQTANIDELTADLSEVVQQRDDARKRLELYEKRENSDDLHSVLVEKSPALPASDPSDPDEQGSFEERDGKLYIVPSPAAQRRNWQLVQPEPGKP